MWLWTATKELFLVLLICTLALSQKLALQEIVYSCDALLPPSAITGITWCGAPIDTKNVAANGIFDNSNTSMAVYTLYGLDGTCNVTKDYKGALPIFITFTSGCISTTVKLADDNKGLLSSDSDAAKFNTTLPATTPAPTTATTKANKQKRSADEEGGLVGDPSPPAETTTAAPEYKDITDGTPVTVTLKYRYIQPADVQNISKNSAAVVVAVLEGLILGAILAVFIYRVYTGAKRSQNAAMYGADPYADATQNRSYDNNAWGNPPPRNNGISMDTMSPRTTQPTPQEARPNLVPVDLNSPQPRAPMPRPPADPLQDPWSDRVPAPGTRDQDPFDGYGY